MVTLTPSTRYLTAIPILFLTGTILLLSFSPAPAQTAAKGVVLKALEDELARAQKVLAEKGSPPPYFLGYEVIETREVRATASHGALRSSTNEHSRKLDIDIRVGDYHLDNTHKIRGEFDLSDLFDYSSVDLPVEDDLDALKSRIWLATDRRYRSAARKLIQVHANRTVKVKEEDTSADFSRESPQQGVLPLASIDADRTAWEEKMKRYSAIFRRYADIYDGTVGFSAEATNKYFVTTEGTSLQHGVTRYRIMIMAKTKADDGMELFRYESFNAHTPGKLPDDSTIIRSIETIARDLQALRTAPVIEPYTGPAILSGRASGVFFHEIFGHRIEGHRQKDEDDGQTFTKKINQEVLPDFISIYDDPTTESINGIDLNGYYHFDDEGVKAQRVAVVEKGILKNFLMSRSPVEGFRKSNGHGRKQPGMMAVGRQGNLIIQATKTVSEAKLREMLIKECRKQGKTFGLIFKDISGGFTFTGRGVPQAFTVMPIMVYRVYTDGRPDELIRGADLIGTPLTSFSKIIAAGDRTDVFNGMCGAESGWVPVAAVSPSILTTQIEVQKRGKASDRPPILPAPDKDNPN